MGPPLIPSAGATCQPQGAYSSHSQGLKMRRLRSLGPLRTNEPSNSIPHTIHTLFGEPCPPNSRSAQGPASLRPLTRLSPPAPLQAHASPRALATNVRFPGSSTAKPWRRKDPVPAVRLPPVLSPGAGALLRMLLRPRRTNAELQRELESAGQRQGGPEDIQVALAYVRREKQWGVAIEVYEWLLLAGLLRPDVRTFNLMLEAYGRAGEPQKCAALFQAMQEGTGAVQERLRGWGAQARPVTAYSASHSGAITSRAAPATAPTADSRHNALVTTDGLSQEEGVVPESAEGTEADQGHTVQGTAGAEGGEGPAQEADMLNDRSEAPLAVGGAPLAADVPLSTEEAQAGSEEAAEVAVVGRGVLAEGACIPSEASWNLLIAAYSQAGMPKEAEAAFEDMKARGYTPSLVTLNTMLEVYGSTGDVGAAERIFARIERGRKEGPTVGSFTLMIAAYARVGWASKAEALFRRMYEVALIPDRGTFLAMMSAYASCDMARSASAAFQGMLRMAQAQAQAQSQLQSRGLSRGLSRPQSQAQTQTPSQAQVADVVSCNALLAAHLAHPEEALSLLRSMSELYGVEPDTSSYQLVSQALAEAGMWQELDDLLESIPESLTADGAPAEVAAQRRRLQALACARGGEPEGLEVHLREIAEHAGHAGGVAPRAAGAADAAGVSDKEASVLRLTALGRSGDLEGLFSLLENLQQQQQQQQQGGQGKGKGGGPPPKVEVEFMNVVVEALGAQGEQEKAEELFATLLALTGCAPSGASYAALMAGPAQRKNLRKCLGLLKRMGAEGVPVDAAVRRALLRACRSEAQEDEVYEALFAMQGNKKKKYA